MKRIEVWPDATECGLVHGFYVNFVCCSFCPTDVFSGAVVLFRFLFPPQEKRYNALYSVPFFSVFFFLAMPPKYTRTEVNSSSQTTAMMMVGILNVKWHYYTYTYTYTYIYVYKIEKKMLLNVESSIRNRDIYTASSLTWTIFPAYSSTRAAAIHPGPCLGLVEVTLLRRRRACRPQVYRRQ